MRIIQTSVRVPATNNVYSSCSHNGKKQEEYFYKRIVNFAICDLCYWCASCIKLDELRSRCPFCDDDSQEFKPLYENEAYTFDYNTKCGIILEFYNRSERDTEGLYSK